jgi:GDP-D-mannose 3', 5'-epimerase
MINKNMECKTAVVTGAGGFIGNHLVSRLKSEGYWVRGVDIKYPEFSKSDADEFIICDLAEDKNITRNVFINPHNTGRINDLGVDEVYSLAAWMGGAGVIFTGENDADIARISSSIDINTADACYQLGIKKVLTTSSACAYNHKNQEDPDNPNCKEDSIYPAWPDSVYGWSKLYSEILYDSYRRNKNLDVKIVRLHNVFGPLSCFDNGKEKAPAAICRKVLTAKNGEIEIWGDGTATRSFLFIDECINGIRRLMESDFSGPVNLGSEEMVSINQLVDMACSFENKRLIKKHIPGPLGVRGRNSDNQLIKEKLGWQPDYPLMKGLEKTYFWIKKQLEPR